MSLKQIQTKLTIDKKYEILQDLKSGVSVADIAKKYGIKKCTVYKIRANEDNIRNFFETHSLSTSSSKKYLSKPRKKNVDRIIYQWYMQCIDTNIQITEADLCQKAREVYTTFERVLEFNDGVNWLKEFKRCYRIHETDIDEDIPISNEVALDDYKVDFRKLLQDEGYTLENIYKADNAALMWTAVPEKTSLFHCKKPIRNKEIGEIITTVFCTNATGCHKLPALIIGRVANPHIYHTLDLYKLPVLYKANTHASIDINIFNEWFEECFLKSVVEKQLSNGTREKTLLLLESSLHHNSGILCTKDEFVKIMYIPCDVTSSTQPMDHGIIACFKRMYRNELLETLTPLSHCNTEEELIDNHYQLNVIDCCRMVHDAWSRVNNEVLRKAWDRLLKHESEQSAEDFEIIEEDIDEALATLYILPGCRGCDRSAVINWFQIDKEHKKIQPDINDMFQDFINDVLGTQRNEFTDDIFEYIPPISPQENA